MVVTSHALNYIYSSKFLHTLDFLRERKPRPHVKTVRITHFSAEDVNYRYGERGWEALRQLLCAIPEDSLTHLECVYFRA